MGQTVHLIEMACSCVSLVEQSVYMQFQHCVLVYSQDRDVLFECKLSSSCLCSFYYFIPLYYKKDYKAENGAQQTHKLKKEL